MAWQLKKPGYKKTKAHEVAFMGLYCSVQDNYKSSLKVSCSHIEIIMKMLL